MQLIPTPDALQLWDSLTHHSTNEHYCLAAQRIALAWHGAWMDAGSPNLRLASQGAEPYLEALIDHNPAELSGGEQQRVAVARALMNSPKVLFADEPSGNLDSENAAMLHDLFFELREKTGQTIVMVTHNEDLANRADRSLRMADGRFV